MGPVAEISQPERVAIIGAGVIGAAWAARWILCGSDALVYDPGPETERIVTEVAENARHSWERMGLAPVREGSLTITKSIEEATDEVSLIQESVPESVNLKKQVLEHSLFPESRDEWDDLVVFKNKMKSYFEFLDKYKKKNKNFYLWDITKVLCEKNCRAFDDGNQIYHDSNHIAAYNYHINKVIFKDLLLQLDKIN